LYRRPLAEDEMRAAKRNLVAETGEHYTQLKNSGQLDGRFDGWMSRGLNNARLASVATYQDLVPGFQAILQECHGKLGCFYTEVAKLSKLPKPERLARLQDQSRTERHAFHGATIGRKHTLPD
jgi:predicted aminopeptidase